MRKLLTILFILLVAKAHATIYYVSNSGNDANNGTSTATPWQNISKVNSTTFVAGDQILFKRGDTFYGSITVAQSGSAGNPIIFGAYGTGANPIITGFTSVTSWTNKGGNIWESDAITAGFSYTNVVAINGVNTPMGRYPNTGWLTYQSHSGFTSITSSDLTGTPDWTGAGVLIKRNRYTFKVGSITGQSGSTLTYTDASGNTDALTDGFGFFIQNDLRTLDQQNEWYYNPSTKKLSIYSTSEPVNVQVVTLQNLLTVSGNRSYVTIDGLSFIGANSTTIQISSTGTKFTIQNCDIQYNGLYAIFMDYSTYPLIQNNTINYTNSESAIKLGGGATNPSILSNTIKNTGLYPGMMLSAWSTGAIASSVDNCLVQYNNIDSSAYNGIFAGGVNMKLKNNVINHSCLLGDDGGGIYISGSSSGDSPGKEVINNIVLNTSSDLTGTTSPNDPMGMGIYLDSWSSGVLVQGNTVSGCKSAGGFFSNLDSNTIRDNTFYNNSNFNTGFSSQSEIQVQYLCCNLVRGNQFYDNKYIVKRTDKYAAFYYSGSNDVNQFLLADSNYYVLPNGNTKINTMQQGATITSQTFSDWKTFSSQDTHSSFQNQLIGNSSKVSLIYNPTKVDSIITLGAVYKDVKGESFNNTITLAPYTSAVLIYDKPRFFGPFTLQCNCSFKQK